MPSLARSPRRLARAKQEKMKLTTMTLPTLSICTQQAQRGGRRGGHAGESKQGLHDVSLRDQQPVQHAQAPSGPQRRLPRHS